MVKRRSAEKFLALLSICVLLLSSAGCKAGGADMKKLRDVEYTVVAEPDIPEELKKAMDEKKAEQFQFIYQSGGYLYIAKGYGVQQTSGYSIQAKELYLTKEGLVFDTELTGPGEGASVQETNTYPYIVIKTEYMDKNVIFQ